MRAYEENEKKYELLLHAHKLENNDDSNKLHHVSRIINTSSDERSDQVPKSVNLQRKTY